MTEQTTPAQAQPINFDAMVDKFVKLRDKIKEIKDKHEAELTPYKEAMDRLQGILLDHLNSIGADSVNTQHGTVHRTRKDSASVADMTAFWNWVVSQNDFDFVDRRANVTAVREYIEKHHQVVPGVNFSSTYIAGVRRATTKKS